MHRPHQDGQLVAILSIRCTEALGKRRFGAPARRCCAITAHCSVGSSHAALAIRPAQCAWRFSGSRPLDLTWTNRQFWAEKGLMGTSLPGQTPPGQNTWRPLADLEKVAEFWLEASESSW